MSNPCASLLLFLLLATDLAFIGIHLAYLITPVLSNPLFSIETDRGYSEIYQYVKFLWIIILFAHLLVYERCLGYIAWILVFTYFLLDDSARIHEAFGGYVEANFAFDPPLNLRVKDFGELAISAIAGTVLSVTLVWAYLRESQPFRKISVDILLLIAALVFFGIFFDMLHIALRAGPVIGYTFGIIEDGGEMLVVSLILWYVFMLVLRNSRPSAYLHTILRRDSRETAL